MRRILAITLLAVLALPVAAARDVSMRIDADLVDGLYYWYAGDVLDPDYVVPAGANVTVSVLTRAGFHNLRIKAPVDAVSPDVELPQTPQTSLTFLAPASGSVTFVCDYHTSMDGTMTFSATATDVTATSGQKDKTPLPWALALVALALAAASRRR